MCCRRPANIHDLGAMDVSGRRDWGPTSRLDPSSLRASLQTRHPGRMFARFGEIMLARSPFESAQLLAPWASAGTRSWWKRTVGQLHRLAVTVGVVPEKPVALRRGD